MIFGKDKKLASPPRRHLNFVRGSYLESTSRPFYAMLFLLPLVAVYEVGTLLVNTNYFAHTQSRVAAFTWLMGLAEWLGLSQNLIWAFPGIVVMMILLCWHVVARHPWEVQFKWLGGMAVECLVLTLPLFFMAMVLNTSKELPSPRAGCAALISSSPSNASTYMADLVTSIGAGIYEELVFRLILMGLLMIFLEDVFNWKGSSAIITAVLISAGLFSAHHYVGFVGGRIGRIQEPFTIGSFIFRTAAGIYFALVFWYRGYGITAGTHAAYNMIYFGLKSVWG